MFATSLGAVIISMATVSLLIAIRIGDHAIKNAGSYPLTRYEKSSLLNAGFTLEDIDDLELDVKSLPKEL